jgi:hypothetical protein
MSRQDQWDDDNNEQPQQVPPHGTVEYWSYVLRQQRRESQQRRQQVMGLRLNNRMQRVFREFPAIEQHFANMRMEE